MSITRRIFLRDSALAVVGTAAIPSFLTRAAFGAAAGARNKRLVVIFQRGAADGLNIVVPHGEQASYAMRPSLPRILTGSEPAIAVNNINDFGVGGRNSSSVANTFEAMYANSVDAVLHGTGNETFEAVKMLKSANPAKYAPAPGANYPRGRFGESLKELAQLIKANLGVQVAFADIGGWDHHVIEGSTQGQLANVLRDFWPSLSAFWVDLCAR